MSKSITIKSNTHYYEPDRTRLFNRVPNSYSFSFKSMRSNELYIRSYFEYYENSKNGGYTCFLTLTYNNKNLPHYLGFPCFNNQHINKLIHALRNRMQRNFGTDFKYLITKEYGSKFSRPHYHALFFVGSSLKCPCRKFVQHVKELWEGSYVQHGGNYKLMKHGLVYAGQNFGEISSHHALEYTCKYAIKDINAHKREHAVYNAIIEDVYSRVSTEFLADQLEDYSNELDDNGFPHWHSWLGAAGVKLKNVRFYSLPELSKIFDVAINDRHFHKWLDKDQFNEVTQRFREFRLSYSCKPQKSNELGLAALHSNCLNKQKGTLCVWRGNKVKVVPVPLYIYRKLFYEKPFIDPNTGNVKYILSEAGIQHKIDNYFEYKHKVINEFMTAKSFVLDNRLDFLKEFNQFTESDLNNYLDVSKICDYVVVYYGRYYSADTIPPIKLEDDMRYSLVNSYSVDVPFRNVIFSKNKACLVGYTSYNNHPYFENIDRQVELYFSIIDYHFNYKDNDLEYKNELYKRIKEYRNSLTFKSA